MAGKNATLEVGAVQVPVSMVKISEAKEIKPEWATPDGNARKQQYVDAETGELVATEDCLRGFRVGDEFRPIPDEALDAVTEELKAEYGGTFAVEGFLGLDEVPWERVTASYYLRPQRGHDAAKKSMKLLHAALTETERAGYFKLVLTSRQHLAVVYPRNGSLYVSLLAWAQDFARVKDAEDVLAGVEVDERYLEITEQLIEALSGTREDLDALTDDYRERVAVLYEQAMEGEPITVAPRETKDAPDSLEKQLEASLALAQTQKTTSAKRKPKPKAKATA